MKTTKRKFSLGVKIASILSCVAVLSVGFASWLIVNIPTTPEVTEIGSFEVYEVVDKSVTLAYDWGADDDGADSNADTAAQIIFGKPTSSSVQNPWLQAGADIANEKLTAVLELKITNFKELGSFTVALDPADKFDTALSGGYVAAPTVTAYMASEKAAQTKTTIGEYSAQTGVYTFDLTKITDEDDGTDTSACTVILEFGFNWGTAFNGQNPYTYFNSSTYAAKGADAKTALTELAKIKGVTYKLTFTCTAPSAS